MRRSSSKVSDRTRALRLPAVARAALALAAAAVAVLSLRVDCLIVRETGGRTLAVLPLGMPGERDPSFALSFIHSVARLPVEDFFRVREGRIQLYRTVYRGLGAGLPFTDEGGTASVVDGSIVIDGMDRRFERFALSPSSFTANRLTVQGVRYDLYEMLDGGIATLEVARRPFLIAIAGRMPAKGVPL